jgi:hypothetical protein
MQHCSDEVFAMVVRRERHTSEVQGYEPKQYAGQRFMQIGDPLDAPTGIGGVEPAAEICQVSFAPESQAARPVACAPEHGTRPARPAAEITMEAKAFFISNAFHRVDGKESS